MDHKVGTELERALQRRRAEAVVDREQRTGLMGDLGNGGDIDQFGQRVGGRFDEEQPRIRPDRGAIACQIGRRNEARLDPELRKHIGEQLLRRAEKPSRCHHVVTRFQQRHDHRQDRRHAGCRGDTGFAALERREPCLHRGDGGIGKARIDVAILCARETCGRLGRVLENETRGQVQGLAMLVELAAVGAGPHRKRIEVKFIHVGESGRRHQCSWCPAETRFRSSCPSSPSSWASEDSPRLLATPERYSAVMSPVT